VIDVLKLAIAWYILFATVWEWWRAGKSGRFLMAVVTHVPLLVYVWITL
jgi:hypothetical protein